MKLSRFFAVLKARNKEFLRDRVAITWNVVMPVILVLGFAFVFNNDSMDLFKVGVLGEGGKSGEVAGFLATRHIRFIPVVEADKAIGKVERHQLDMLLDAGTGRYWINERSAKGYILQRLLQEGDGGFIPQTVSGEALRYVDWVIPGVLGMNVMFSSLFGVGFVIVRYRKNGVLKRLRATPLSAFEFLTAQIASRLWLIVLLTVLVYLGTDLLVDYRMYGSHLTLLLVLVMGTLSMISLGLIVAARMRSEEAANGILNLISWPMMLLSGVWFSLEGSHEIVRLLAQLLPLTHMLEAARMIMLDGAGVAEVAKPLLILLLMTGLFLVIGARSFRWE